MLVLLLFAFLAGLGTVFAPCIWPLLPIVLSSSTTGGHRKPLGITLGVICSFSFFTLSVSYLVMLFHFDPNILRVVAALAIAFLGLTMLIPALLVRYELLITKLSSFIAGRPVANHHGFFGGFITGLSIGVIWSPCAGPILATIATLAATAQVSIQVILLTLAFAAGVGIPLFLFSMLGAILFQKSKFVSNYTVHLQRIFGIVMILTAFAIYTNYDKVIQTKLLDMFPQYTNITTQLESKPVVQEKLNALKGKQSDLSNSGKAPDFTGITNWLNLSTGSRQSLSIKDLKAKVVLVDFWTYTCINCIRTLPFVTSWYEKYKDLGFVVVGVHTPEFAFEKDTGNVENAIKMYNIHYPVAQDNNYATWNAYNNQYWPAEYLIDANGNIRHTHFGEGEYDQTEMAIKDLLKEAGKNVDQNIVNVKDQTPTTQLTPETYLGTSRMERFASNENPNGGVQTFSVPQSIPTDYFAYKGTWVVTPEDASSLKDSSLILHFFSNRVFLVVTPSGNPPAGGDKAKILLDGKPISPQFSGKDVLSGEAIFDTSRLYELVNLKGSSGDHVLEIDFETPGTSVFAFTFG